MKESAAGLGGLAGPRELGRVALELNGLAPLARLRSVAFPLCTADDPPLPAEQPPPAGPARRGSLRLSIEARPRPSRATAATLTSPQYRKRVLAPVSARAPGSAAPSPSTLLQRCRVFACVLGALQDLTPDAPPAAFSWLLDELAMRHTISPLAQRLVYISLSLL